MCGFQKVSPLGGAADDSLRSLLADTKLSFPIEVLMTSRYWFSLSIPTSGVMHLIGWTLVAAREAVCVAASAKPGSSSLGLSPSGSATLLDELVWGHWFIAPRLTLPKSWRRSQLVNTMCSLTTSLNSMTPPAKGQKSGLSSGVSFSAQYCSPLA